MQLPLLKKRLCLRPGELLIWKETWYAQPVSDTDAKGCGVVASHCCCFSMDLFRTPCVPCIVLRRIMPSAAVEIAFGNIMLRGLQPPGRPAYGPKEGSRL